MVTQYIPPHLDGLISDIRQEPGGGVSFVRPGAPQGYPDSVSERVTLSPDTAKATFDRSYRMANLGEAMDAQYAPPRLVQNEERLQRGIAGWLKRSADSITGTAVKNVATSGLLGAALGGVGGAWLAAKNDKPMLDKAVLYALLGGVGAAGLGALAQYSGRKRLAEADAGFGDQVIKGASVGSALAADTTLTQQQKYMLAEEVMRLRQQDRAELENLVGRASGFGVGLLIAKFLGMRGLLSPLVLALIGGAVGNAMTTGGPRYNAMGQPVNEHY